MRTKLVIWGTDANEERVLLALELLPENNEVALYVFPQEAASDDFVKSMMEEWREDKPVELPANHQRISRPLTVSDSLLPEEFKVERGDVIQRAQSEWAFVVLSYKLQKAFRSELDTFSDRISAMQEFSQPMWEELKAFWDKVQLQVKERNLFREHVDSLRDQSNELFARMKKFRQQADAQFRKVSQDNARQFAAKLEALHARIEEGKHLINTFEALKSLQREYHALELTRDDRNRIWEKMDSAFKLIKEKRFGSKPASGAAQDALSRIENRMKGLLEAMGKMVKSIERDDKDLQFESRRADTSGAQLEVQLRQAKIAMIEDRVRSKREKLADMEKTKAELDNRMASIRRKIAEEEERLRVEEAKVLIKERIAREIEESGRELEDKADELTAAAQEIAELSKKRGAAASPPGQKPFAKSPNPDQEATVIAEATAETAPIGEITAQEPAAETPSQDQATQETAPSTEITAQEPAAETPAQETEEEHPDQRASVLTHEAGEESDKA
jgi:DNA repair exonuclease SbcCD ATPase subunit